MSRIRGEGYWEHQRTYMRAYRRALAALARNHPAEFAQLLDDERQAPARRAVLDTYATKKASA
jgi:hypothetical protein